MIPTVGIIISDANKIIAIKTIKTETLFLFIASFLRITIPKKLPMMETVENQRA
jgi:hypothetical protein